MKAKLLLASLLLFLCAVAVAAATPPGERLYWTLYLPIAAAVAAWLAMRKR